MLEEVQIRLLWLLATAQRAERQEFMGTATFGGETLTHPGLPNGEVKVFLSDVRELGRKSLVRIDRESDGAMFFVVTPEGLRLADALAAPPASPKPVGF